MKKAKAAITKGDRLPIVALMVSGSIKLANTYGKSGSRQSTITHQNKLFLFSGMSHLVSVVHIVIKSKPMKITDLTNMKSMGSVRFSLTTILIIDWFTFMRIKERLRSLKSSR